MVLASMNPKANIESADVSRIWAVLNPDMADWIPFDIYVQGMIKIRKDPELSQVCWCWRSRLLFVSLPVCMCLKMVFAHAVDSNGSTEQI